MDSIILRDGSESYFHVQLFPPHENSKSFLDIFFDQKDNIQDSLKVYVAGKILLFLNSQNFKTIPFFSLIQESSSSKTKVLITISN